MSIRFARHAAFLSLVLVSFATHAAQAVYTLDPVHTRVMFSVSHAGFSNPMGTISGTTGTLVFDPDDWASARVEAKIPVTRLDLGDKKWNDAVLDRTFFDVKKHPEATFVSTHVERVDPMHAKVTGNLTLHGVTRAVQLDVVFHQAKRHPMPPFRRTAGFSATGTLSRAAFGMTSWKSVVGDAVEIRIEAEGTRSREDASDVPSASTSAVPSGTSTVSPPSNTTILPAPATSMAPASNSTTTP